ncbi:MAG TPA: radical SAM protein [Longimicrobiaceae bacterium]|jgi:predicted DNA-binding helix-hairpin-helix protein|nr:radical SAM protein [Longimicrobiaceae bacterium]
MDTTLTLEQKLELLMTLAADDHEGTQGSQRALPPRLRHTKDVGALRPLNIRELRVGSGRVSLMRILMTNACSFNCHYCPMRRDRNMPRTLLKPAELVRIFLEAYHRGWCGGLFITTGIPGRPTKVMDDLIEVMELLREKHRFTGYVHVKMPPGGEPAQIERLTRLASRVSLNLEAPCGSTLVQIAPEKSLDRSLASLDAARKLVVGEWRQERDGRPRDPLHPGGTSGMTMQFVVGATPDTDRTIIGKVTELYGRGGIHHAHFSAFRPIRDTPMEDAPETPVLREQRLYQADYLLRRYGFARDEVVFDATGNLPLGLDPKTAWALANPQRFPVEVKTASYDELVRVPGIGPGTAKKIVAERGGTVIRGVADLRKMGAVTTRAAGFLTIGGKRLDSVRWTEQMGLWAPEDDAGIPRRTYSVSPGTFR